MSDERTTTKNLEKRRIKKAPNNGQRREIMNQKEKIDELLQKYEYDDGTRIPPTECDEYKEDPTAEKDNTCRQCANKYNCENLYSYLKAQEYYAEPQKEKGV